MMPMPPPSAGPKPEMEMSPSEMPAMNESFSCPSCGAKLSVEPAQEAEMEHEALGAAE